MGKLASQGILLGLTLVMGLVLYTGWGAPYLDLSITAAAALIILLALGIERRFARLLPPAPSRRAELAGDIGSFILVFGLFDSLLKWLSPFLILALFGPGEGINAPLWLQVILATLWIEFAAWASHWAHHRYKPLWALHAMHHSPEHLHTLNNFRFHPLNHLLNHAAMILPLLFAGIAQEAVLIYSAISLPVLLLQHSDINFRFGRLNLILNTNELHLWHHSAHPSEGMMNLGRALVLWDHVFGTYLNPAGRRAPDRIGLFRQSRDFPAAARFLAQLAWPFTPRCCRTSA